MKKTYKSPVCKQICLGNERMFAGSKDPEFLSEEPVDMMGEGPQLVKGHSAWDDEW